MKLVLRFLYEHNTPATLWQRVKTITSRDCFGGDVRNTSTNCDNL